jgi:uncharacterized protein (UPF0335 family)
MQRKRVLGALTLPSRIGTRIPPGLSFREGAAMPDSNEAAASRGRQAADPQSNTGGVAADRLRSIVERIERLEEEKKALAGDIKDIYVEAKSAGFDVKALRTLLSLRRKEPAEVEEQDALVTLYRQALGMG